MSDFLPFALPDIGEEEINAVVETLRSGWVTTGPKSQQFEQAFSEFLGGGVEAVAVNSATAGLHLALEALGVGSGDEVITTPYTFTATAEVIRYLGADPVFVDIDAETFNIDPNSIERAITDRTKVIIPVHFAGLSCEMVKIRELAKSRNLNIVEDAAHALPCTENGEIVGSSDNAATVFSFYATKTITTGEGGMIVTRDPEIALRCRTMRLHGISRGVYDRYVSEKPAWEYEVVAPGYKYNMPDPAAAMGIEQLKKARRFHERRQHIANRYSDAFTDLPIKLPAAAPGNDAHAWHLYVIRLLDQARIDRNDFIDAMASKGIGCSVHFIPLHLHPYWSNTYKLSPEDYPLALHAYERAVSLPIFTRMTDDDQERVINAVRDILNG